MRDNSLGHYQRLWNDLELLPDWQERVAREARRVAAGRARYERVAPATQVDWSVIGCIHSLEAGLDWTKNLHNGESWARRTTLVPAGRGPFGSWEDAAIDALRAVRDAAPYMWDGFDGWSVGEIGRFLEIYNGGGYMRRGVESPYLVSGSKAGVGVGKYVADGKYRADAVSAQVGAFPLLWMLAKLGAWQPKMTPGKLTRRLVGYGSIGPAVKTHQHHLNNMRIFLPESARFDVLDVDGKWFDLTREAHVAVFGEEGKG